jgi:hypothetical protein
MSASVHVAQRGQMSFRKNGSKCSPTRFVDIKSINTVEKVTKNMATFVVFKNLPNLVALIRCETTRISVVRSRVDPSRVTR